MVVKFGLVKEEFSLLLLGLFVVFVGRKNS